VPVSNEQGREQLTSRVGDDLRLLIGLGRQPIKRDAPLAAKHRRVNLAGCRLALGGIKDCLRARGSGGHARSPLELAEQLPLTFTDLAEDDKARA
jgi:hypothetical protein